MKTKTINLYQFNELNEEGDGVVFYKDENGHIIEIEDGYVDPCGYFTANTLAATFDKGGHTTNKAIRIEGVAYEENEFTIIDRINEK
jgi:hypothetical protein